MNLKNIVAGCILFCFTIFAVALAYAEEPTPMNLPPLSQLNPKQKIDSKKMAVAEELSSWLKTTMKQEHARAVIVARQGSKEVRKQDPTGMAHAGLAIYTPEAEPNQALMIYELVHDPGKRPPTGQLWRTSPVHFFYGLKGFEDKGYQKDALILIPSLATQERLYQAIDDARYQPLFFTKSYHLMSAPASNTSLNCNKWLLMNLTASQLGNYTPDKVLEDIRQNFKPSTIKMNPLVRLIAKTNEKVKASEVPLFAPIQTVTIESLYRSNWFEKKIFFSGRSL